MSPELHERYVCIPEVITASGKRVERKRGGPQSKTKENNIWAIGMLIFHMFSGTIPWGTDMDVLEIVARHKEGQRPRCEGKRSLERGLNFSLWRLALDCLLPLPRHRPSIQSVQASLRTPTLALSVAPAQLQRTVLEEVPDLSHEVKAVSAAPTGFSGTGRLSHMAHWAPCEINPLVRKVCLSRKDDTHLVNSDGWSTELLREILPWRRVRHNNLVPLLGICKMDTRWYAVSPYWENTYHTWRRDNEGRTPFRERLLIILRDVASALQFLHDQAPLPIVHGGVRVDNLYIPPMPTLDSDEDTLCACLGDFRQMRHVGTTETEPLRQDLIDFAAMYRELLGTCYRFPGDGPSDKPRVSAINKVYIGCVRGNVSASGLLDLLSGLVAEAQRGGLGQSDE
ncbi:hypothetical protein EXIGLDRAFT_770267 [Exidia glandulosa HHB12029]|uniref:Protein kinase domain-containing protein n=1 Tax=Exidia glandulosa HHB12029 TaxID=1314781 RepID=A0A165GTP7_EXIGL|nr:hypothetical protein EXIGLDRAFT_770267 [Exidia glandulosa HHB12029]